MPDSIVGSSGLVMFFGVDLFGCLFVVLLVVLVFASQTFSWVPLRCTQATRAALHLGYLLPLV
jgi:ABC-type microcin C transport system permease subunit YejB